MKDTRPGKLRTFRKSAADMKRSVNSAMAFYGMPPEFQTPVRDYKPRPAKPKAAGELSELMCQIRVISWWDKNCHEYKLPPVALFSIPNGASLTSSYGGKNLKDSGMRKGVEDLFLAVPAPFAEGLWFHGLFIEMKVAPNDVEMEQHAMHHFHARQGYQVKVAWSHEEAIGYIKEYLGG